MLELSRFVKGSKQEGPNCERLNARAILNRTNGLITYYSGMYCTMKNGLSLYQ